ncbi:LysR family transcriptional regulator [Aquabacter cavernae]|uniref:LysR family transcriptional regulator n=1 Tax=Aquabacter cavernae TaxID=2496029 RepID=UPI000F8EC50F|nr:LysR family transcriptional regulator [Aquabacter cavernae]
MFIRQLRYLVAVAREAHFGRAAESCSVSQPALSAGIRKLEEELGVPLVIRGHRFLGLTEEGQRILGWAQRIVADHDGLRQELSGVGSSLTGALRIGAIPTALPALPPLVNAFCARHPLVQVQIQSLPSAAIQKGLDDLEIDAGVTYLENEPLARVRSVQLYAETYVLVTCDPQLRERSVKGERVTWEEAARLPLCLLTRDMQNRRILDRLFGEAGVTVQPRIEANSFAGVWAMVRSGQWSSILPASEAQSRSWIEGLVAVPFVEPSGVQPVGLAICDRDPPPPVAAALFRLARDHASAA